MSEDTISELLPGMSLRDYIAAKIAASIVASGTTRTGNLWHRLRYWVYPSGYAVSYSTPKYHQVAEAAYAQADAILAERDKRNGASL